MFVTLNVAWIGYGDGLALLVVSWVRVDQSSVVVQLRCSSNLDPAAV